MIPCTCGCNRQYPRSEIYDLRVKRPVSKHCHEIRMRWPLVRESVSARRLPGTVYRMVRL